MTESYTQLPSATARLNLLVADHFSGHENPIAEIDAETRAPNGSAIWTVSLLEGEPTTFGYLGLGYWVRHAVLSTGGQLYIRCQVGFSAESGRFIKLLPYHPEAKPGVWLLSGPLTHLLSVST